MAGQDLDLTMVAKIGRQAVGFDDGAVIFREGDTGDRMFVIQAGEVALEHRGKVVATIGRGDVFGEMALVDGSPRSATAVARGRCELTALDERTFIYLVDEMPFFALHMLRVLARRLRAMNELV